MSVTGADRARGRGRAPGPRPRRGRAARPRCRAAGGRASRVGSADHAEHDPAHERRQDRGGEHAELGLLELRPSKAMPAIRNETVNPIPATTPPPTITGQLIDGRTPAVQRRVAEPGARHDARAACRSRSRSTMPSVIGDVTASSSRSAVDARCPRSRARTAARSRSSSRDAAGTGAARSSRSPSETPSCAERASAGVGCSRKERVSSVARSRSLRAGG